MTEPELLDLEHRLERGWVIRPDQIRALILMARAHLDGMSGGKPSPVPCGDDLNAGKIYGAPTPPYMP